MRRAFDCSLNNCGQHLEAANDEELYRLGQKHMQDAHPEVQLSDDDLRTAMAPRIYAVPER
jgi:predicted small metal-binding protein